MTDVTKKEQSRILAVDDNPINIAILEETFCERYDLKTADTGEEALQVASSFRPDLVLLDIMMPGIDGYEVCRRLRRHPNYCELRRAKIIIVSAKAALSERLAGYEAGADDYVTKPFDKNELESKVRVFLKLKSLEEVDELKNNVLGLLSHETRTPLTGILGPTELLMSPDSMDVESRLELARLAHSSARDLQRFLDKAITLNGLKAGNWRLEAAQLDLCAVAAGAHREFAAESTRQDVRIEEAFRASPQVVGDAEGLRRVVVALLENAVRFSPPDGKVELSVSSSDAKASLCVTDAGPGIERSLLPHVFDELTGPDLKHHAQGHGLSLAIARQIVRRHGGSIAVESPEGKGATFSVVLPVA